ncbi:MAG: Stk1 family PASTA domain-containing Ser/Thr kinase [Actinomycetaceae bacterium]|nr:Stk1 family PASTA domain-containing Ser/Thr kinase [Actinomycetaceae bacterium]
MNDIPRVLGKRYELGDLIGRGGMAQVHLGYDTRLSRTVAIKILRTDLAADPMFLARFRREAQSAAALNHPSIVAVYDTGEELMTMPTGHELSLPYIVMEYVKGRTVASLLSGGQPVPIDEAVQIVVGVLSALEYSHHEGIIHRDIKPGNVMLTPDAKVKVMDFGIARAIADSSATMTQTNSVVGTAQYLSPEQARGEVVDARSDLYSAGCLLYELLTGKPPFTGDSAVAVAYQHVSETPRLASQVYPDIPDAVDRVVMKSLAKQRDERYQSAEEFRSDLLAAARGEGVEAPAATSYMATPFVPPVPPAPSSDPAATRIVSPMPSGQQTGVQQAVGTDNGRNRNRMMIWAGVALLALALVIGVLALRNVFGSPSSPSTSAQTVTVPALADMNEAQVKQALENADLKYKKGEDKTSNDVDKGLFVDSNPEPGSTAESGSTVTVHFSSGPSKVIVPDLRGMTTDEARKELSKNNLTLGNVTEVNDSSQDQGKIVSSTPTVGSSVDAGDTVDVAVSSGKVTVPDVVGYSESDATSTLESRGFSVSVATSESTEPAGTVISQDPGGSTSARSGATVTITVSSGNGSDGGDSTDQPTNQQTDQPNNQPTAPAEPTQDPTVPPTEGGDQGGGDQGGGEAPADG